MKFPQLFYLIAVLAHLPMMVGYSQIMWNKGHYQFFPLLLIVAAWLAFDRLAGSKLQSDPQSRKIALGFWLADLGLLSLSALLYSSVLALPALMVGLAALAIDRYGWAGFQLILPVWLLLLFIVPPPGNLDLTLIQKMQFGSSQLASWILDAFGQVHFREGVTLITAQKQFFTEEACSGIRSLFSSLAAIAVFGIIRRYPLWRQLVNFAQTIVWVLAGNALRIALVVYVADNWTDSIASGTNHEMLGLAVFAFIFLMALSTDRAIHGFLRGDFRDGDRPVSPANRLAATSAAPSAPVSVPNPPTTWQWGLLGLFAVALLFSASLTFAKNFDTFSQRRLNDDEMVRSQQADLPASVNGWEVVSFEPKLRDEHSLLAPESYIWTLKQGNRQAIVSLDSPYDAFHDLIMCYSGLGWQGKSNHRYQRNQQGVLTGHSMVELAKPDAWGIVYFSAFTRTGQMIIPAEQFSITSRVQNVVRNIYQAVGIKHENPDYRDRVPAALLPVSQIQVLYEQATPITAADEEELLKLFETVRSTLLKSARFPSAAATQ